MQKDLPRHFTAFTIVIAVYATIIGVIFYTQTAILISSTDTKEKVLEMSLSTFVPKVIAPPKKEKLKPAEEVKTIIEEVKEESVIEPKLEHKLEPIVIPKPVVKKPVIKPLEKKVEQKPKVDKNKVVKKKTSKKEAIKKPKRTAKKQTSKRQPSSKQAKSSMGERNKFFNQLRSKIDKHKFYPRIAKKRRMEGSVKVRFSILKSGKVGNVSVTGPKVFYKSARNAVKSAFPISLKNIPISLPKTVNLTLHYKIR